MGATHTHPAIPRDKPGCRHTCILGVCVSALRATHKLCTNCAKSISHAARRGQEERWTCRYCDGHHGPRARPPSHNLGQFKHAGLPRFAAKYQPAGQRNQWDQKKNLRFLPTHSIKSHAALPHLPGRAHANPPRKARVPGVTHAKNHS